MPQLDRQKALSRVGEDASLLAELAGLFLDEYPRLLAAIRDGLAAGDAQAVQGPAHQLKGLLAQFCADAARESAWQVELAAREGDLVRAAGFEAELRGRMDLLYADLVALASA